MLGSLGHSLHTGGVTGSIPVAPTIFSAEKLDFSVRVCSPKENKSEFSGSKSHPILHASVSCKWTIRSDRAQNARSEGLNLVKNRKGRLPHIVVITAEPTPSRIASIALGTGEIDCVYHFALPELEETLAELQYDDAKELVAIMVQGKRLRDISDLPLDLAV